MKNKRFAPLYIALIAILLSSLSLPMTVKAGGTVGNGTPESCTEAAFDNALSGGGLVTFNCGPSPYTLTITNQKTISANTTIDGGNLIKLSGGNSTGLFTVNADVSLDLQYLTLTEANANPGGAVFNNGTVLLSNVLFSNNAAAGGIAGAVINLGTLIVINSSFINNHAGLYGGALANNGTATITSTTFAGNQAPIAGAIYNNGPMTIRGSNFDNNTTTNGGGAGIFNDDELTVFNSTFSNNTTSVGQKGGGIFNVIYATAMVIRSSFINNGAPGGFGGAIYDEGSLTILRDVFTGNSTSGGLGSGVFSSTANLTTVIDSTFSGNLDGNPGGGFVADGPTTIINSTFYANQGGGLANEGSDIVSVKNTILAANTPYNCFSTITSEGHNLEDANSCEFSGLGDLPNTNPTLGPLADNGGPTQTHALLYGSPAINAGTNDGCPPADQRGVMRPLLGTCDIGAYEFGFLIQLPLVRK